MSLAVDTVTGVPGVYRQAAERAAGFPRARTDVAGFVGIAGPNHLDQPVRVDDWRSYEQRFLRDERGRAIAPPAGSRLAECVRAFFTNGGARCWIVNVGESIEASQADALLDRMLGVFEPTGLERLLQIREVAIVALPELDASVTSPTSETFDAPIAGQDRFICCPGIIDLPPLSSASATAVATLFQPLQILFAQRYLVERCGRDKWRVFALVSPPAALSAGQAIAWRDAVVDNLADGDAGALYWPWVFAQDKPGAAIELRPPIGYVAGVYARRDLARGPHVAPAAESLRGVVGVQTVTDDEEHGRANATGVNVLRAFANAGIQVWGARTLLWPAPATARDAALGWVNVRRCLSAIERTCDVIGQGVVFEPNLPIVRFQLSQAIFAYLLELFRAGAFLGQTPEESFFVRCDARNNPADQIANGLLLCEVGVAIAAPAEFVVFRIGRREGVVEIQEVT